MKVNGQASPKAFSFDCLRHLKLGNAYLTVNSKGSLNDELRLGAQLL